MKTLIHFLFIIEVFGKMQFIYQVMPAKQNYTNLARNSSDIVFYPESSRAKMYQDGVSLILCSMASIAFVSLGRRLQFEGDRIYSLASLYYKLASSA